MSKPSTLSRREIRKILKANRGAQAKIARALGIGPSAISMWLAGKSPSSTLERKIPGIARALAAGEPIESAVKKAAA